MKDQESIAPWTDVWQYDSSGRAPDRPPLDLVVEPSWLEFIDLLPRDARLLELATGNGTVARTCARRAQARQLPLEIDAVDAADINPPVEEEQAGIQLPDIRYHGGVWLEDLPFEDDAFNAAVSQFGFDYADESRAVSELGRVLQPDGMFRFVMHARGGAVWEDIDFRSRRLNGILAENGAANLVLALVRAQQQNDEDAFARKLKHLAAATEEANALAKEAPSDDSALFYAKEFLYVWSHRSRYRPNDLLRSLEDGWAHATGTATRYEQMLKVARSGEDIATLCERLRSNGLFVRAVRQVCSPENGKPVAWQVDGVKRR